MKGTNRRPRSYNLPARLYWAAFSICFMIAYLNRYCHYISNAFLGLINQFLRIELRLFNQKLNINACHVDAEMGAAAAFAGF